MRYSKTVSTTGSKDHFYQARYKVNSLSRCKLQKLILKRLCSYNGYPRFKQYFHLLGLGLVFLMFVESQPHAHTQIYIHTTAPLPTIEPSFILTNKLQKLA